MGIDISLFAKKSKTRLMADRAWICDVFNSQNILMYALGDKFRNSSEGLVSEEALYYLNECLNLNAEHEDREADSKDYAKYWLDCMIAFVKSHPDDTFFILTDHEDEYYDICDAYSKEDPLGNKNVQ